MQSDLSTGASELRLVDPQCEWNGVKSYATAVGASGGLDEAKSSRTSRQVLPIFMQCLLHRKESHR